MKPRATIAVAVAALATAMSAQEPAPRGIFRARFLSSSGTREAGGLVFKTAAGATMRCSWDEQTWFERDHEQIFASGLVAGEAIEIVTDSSPAEAGCYVRLVSVVPPQPRFRRRPPVDLSSLLSDPFLTRGDRSLAGVVSAIATDRMVVRTRADQHVRVAIRPETRYLSDGRMVGAAELMPNTRVFIRGITDLDGNLEAYQVVWGDILAPAARR